MFEKSQFITGYSQLVIRTWSSEEYTDFVLNNPKLALAELGIGVPEEATVEVRIVEATEDGKIENQIARWEEGYETGHFLLVISERPEDFDPADMALDDAILGSLAGGTEPIAGSSSGDNNGGTTIYCCCTPCCCCG